MVIIFNFETIITFFAFFIHKDNSKIMVPVNQSVEHRYGHIFDLLLLQLIQHPLDDLVVIPDVALKYLRDSVLKVHEAGQVLDAVLLAGPSIGYFNQVKITFVKLLVNI